MKKLGIYAGSNPRLPSTWSGTPFNLINALEKQGVICETHCPSEIPLNKTIIERIIRRIAGGAAPYSKACLLPQLNDLADIFKAKGCNAILHMPGNISMPFPGANTGLRHHAFMDSTFRQYWVPWFNERYRERGGISKRILQLELKRREQFYKLCLNQFSHFFVTSPWVSESLMNDYLVDPDRISVCFTGTGNIRNLELERTPAPPMLLFVAKHNYLHKGAALVLQAFRRLREKHNTVELVMVGPDPTALEAQTHESRVHFHPFLEWDDLERLFNRASIFVMPSLYEPYGLVYLESLRCGVPVVCSSSGGMSTIVREFGCGWSLERHHPDDLAEILQVALGDVDACMAKGRNGKSFVESHCSWEACAKIIADTL